MSQDEQWYKGHSCEQGFLIMGKNSKPAVACLCQREICCRRVGMVQVSVPTLTAGLEFFPRNFPAWKQQPDGMLCLGMAWPQLQWEPHQPTLGYAVP